MAIIGKLLKNRRAGEQHLAWNSPSLAGPDTLTVTSTAFAGEAAMPQQHAGKRIGGQDLSPALQWGPSLPEGTAQVLVMVQDVDTPTSKPIVHCMATVAAAAAADGLPEGALGKDTPGQGVTLRKGMMGVIGYRGPGPIKGHGPHRYVFQVFALAEPLPESVATLGPNELVAALTPGNVLARGRLTGTYER